MAKITIEQAESLLAKARKWSNDDSLTDLQLARKQHNALRDGAFSMMFFSLMLVRVALSQDWDGIPGWGLGLMIFTLVFYMIYQSSRYSKVRELFESAAPQSLEELKLHLKP